MATAFYISALVAVLSTALVITRLDAIHAILYLIVSLLSMATVFFILGAPFAAALEVIVYAGAIVVLFVFVAMLLNLGKVAREQERRWLRPSVWLGPAALAAILGVELLLILSGAGAPGAAEPAAQVPAAAVGPKDVSRLLFGPYILCVELASFLLLAGLVGAYHLSRRARPELERTGASAASRARSVAARGPESEALPALRRDVQPPGAHDPLLRPEETSRPEAPPGAGAGGRSQDGGSRSERTPA